MSDFSSLKRFQPTSSTSHAKKTVNAPIRWTGDGTVVAFDQALANTGYVVAHFRPKVMKVIASGTLHTTSSGGRTSWTDTLYRARELIRPIRKILAEHEPRIIVHETPPIGNSRSMRRPDSSILSAMAIWVAAEDTPIRMIDARAAKRYLTGKAGATKKEVRTALENRLGDVFAEPHLRKNEHVYDALALLVTYTKDSK